MNAARRILCGCAFPLMMVALLLVQGGYGSGITCLCGLAAAMIAAGSLAKRKRDVPGLGPVPFLFAALAIAFFISALVNGPTLTTVSEAGAWAAVAGVALFASLRDGRTRARSLDMLCWVGMAFSIAGLLVFPGAIPWSGGVDADRLQFPMTYANSAAVWFASVAFMSLLSESKMLRSLAPVPVAALMLTQSGGALAAFALAAIALAVVWWRSGDRMRIAVAMTQAVVGMGLFLCAYYLPAVPAAACTVAFTAAFAVLPWARGRLPGSIRVPKWVAPAAVALCVVGIALMAVPVLGRSGEAAEHFALRANYVLDGIGLLGASPVVGVGPDNWQYLYQHVQTAAYRTSVVHCSYAQIALDAGLLGLALLVAAAACGCMRLVRARDVRCMLPVGMILVHSLVDFDLQFGSIAFLLGYLLSAPASEWEREGDAVGLAGAGLPPLARLALPWALVVLSVVGCALGYVASQERAHVEAAGAVGDSEAVVALVARSQLASDDPFARSLRLEALRRLGESETAARDVLERGVWYDRQAIIGAEVLYDVGDEERGARLMIEELERSPYDTGLYLAAYDLFSQRGMPAELVPRYNEAARNAARLAES